MEGKTTNYTDFFNKTLTPTNYSAVVTNIAEFVENNLKRDRRIVLVTVS